MGIVADQGKFPTEFPGKIPADCSEKSHDFNGRCFKFELEKGHQTDILECLFVIY